MQYVADRNIEIVPELDIPGHTVAVLATYPELGCTLDYPKEAILVTWRGGLPPKCIELTAKHGNPLIMAPGKYTYLDYPQQKGDLPGFNNWGMPVTTLEMSYQFDPGYGLPVAGQRHILGICGTLWGQDVYMTYLRGLALDSDGIP